MGIQDLIKAAKADTMRDIIPTKETAGLPVQSPPPYSSAEVGGLVSTGNKDTDDIVSKCHVVLWECLREKKWGQCFTREEVMFNACVDTYKKFEKTKWGIGGPLNMMVLVGPVKPAVSFALKLDNDSRWDASFDKVMPLEQWIEMMSARFPDTEFNFYTWLIKTFVAHFIKK